MRKLLVPVFAVTLLLSSCKPIELGLYKVFDHGPSVSERVGRLEEVPGPSPAFYGGKFAFLVTSDVHFGNKSSSYSPRRDEEFYDELRALKRSLPVPPSFGVCLGDVVENGNVEDEFEDYVDWCRTVENILGTGNRVYTTVGNHDLYNDGWEYFEDHVYPYTGFFHFNAGGFSFYFLDTGSSSLGKKQYERFKNAVESDDKPKIVGSCVRNASFFPELLLLAERGGVESAHYSLCGQQCQALFVRSYACDTRERPGEIQRDCHALLCSLP